MSVRRAPVGATIVVALVFCALVTLGVWQMQRLTWKEGLLADIAARAHQAPVAAPAPAEWPNLDEAAYEYRRVTLRGTFAAHQSARIFRPGAAGAPTLGPVYYYYAPLRLTGGGVVLVNRGYAPIAANDIAPPPAGEVEVRGLMRGPEARSMFTPADDPAKGLWYTRDVAAMAKAFGLSDVAPFAIDEEQAAGASPQWPRAGGTELSAPNNHLSYALTWFGLAATLLVIFGFWLRRRGAPAAMN